MVEQLARAFDKEGVDMSVFQPNHFATLAVYYARFLRKDSGRPHNGLARWCFGIRTYVSGAKIEPEAERREHLASQCLPRHYDDRGIAQPAGLNTSCQAIASAPVTCELCHVGLAGHDKLKQHCDRKHCGLAEYRKRTFYKAREAGLCPLLPWVKRNMVQSFQFFRLHSVPSSVNDWTMKATQSATLRREEACAVCAVKDWLENRYPVDLFEAATGTTTWQKHFFAAADEDVHEEEDEEVPKPSGDVRPARGTLLVDDAGVFCFGPKEK